MGKFCFVQSPLKTWFNIKCPAESGYLLYLGNGQLCNPSEGDCL